MIISSININFSLFPDTVAVKYCYDYSHKICQTSLNQEAYGSRLWRPPVCGGSCHGRAFFHLEIETKNQKFQENLKLASKFRLIYSQLLLQWRFICRYDTDIAQGLDSLFWCHTMIRLQFSHTRSFACRGRWQNLLADCFTVGLYRLTITAINHQTFTSSCGSRRFSACDQGSHCGVYPPRSAFFSRLGCI